MYPCGDLISCKDTRKSNEPFSDIIKIWTMAIQGLRGITKVPPRVNSGSKITAHYYYRGSTGQIKLLYRLVGQTEKVDVECWF